MPRPLVPEPSPSIFTYDDYRIYLQNMYEHLKRKSSAFSFRYFSAKAGYRSPSFLKLVIQGRRNLTEDGIRRFSKALKLGPAEAAFFSRLVRFNQAQGIEEKQHYAQEMMQSKVFERLHRLAKAKFEYWSRWYNVAIRELAASEHFREDPEWIAKTLCPAITPEEAAASLRHLQDLGLLKRNASGRLEPAHADVSSGDEVIHTSIAQFHREMILKGREAIDRFEKKDRQISSVTFTLNHENAEKIKEMIHKFRKELIAVSDEEQEEGRVYQMNFQFFPLSEEPLP